MKSPTIPIPRAFLCPAAIAPIVVTILLSCAVSAMAQSHYTSLPQGSDVKIEGTSTLHDWEMEGALIGGFIDFDAGVQLDPSQTTITGLQGDKVPAKSRVIIPVRSVHSKADHLPDVMEHLMQDALKEAQAPRIEFTLKEMTFKGPHEAGKPFDLTVTGDLAIAGRTNSVTFPIKIESIDADKLKVSGTVPVKMTDYGVKPPAPNFGLGLMKTGDDVKIIFDWTLHKRDPLIKRIASEFLSGTITSCACGFGWLSRLPSMSLPSPACTSPCNPSAKRRLPRPRPTLVLLSRPMSSSATRISPGTRFPPPTTSSSSRTSAPSAARTRPSTTSSVPKSTAFTPAAAWPKWSIRITNGGAPTPTPIWSKPRTSKSASSTPNAATCSPPSSGPGWSTESKAAIAARGGITLTGPVLGEMRSEIKEAAFLIIAAGQERIEAYQEEQARQGKPVDPMEMIRLREDPFVRLLAVFTPPQYDEFVLRYSPAAQQLREEMRGMDLTPDQFRNLFSAVGSIIGQPVYFYSGDDSQLLHQQQQLQAQSQALMKTVLGPQVYAAYQLNQDPVYRSSKNIIQQVGAPASAVSPLYEINRATQAELNRIRNDDSLDNDEKVEALAQTQVQQQQSIEQLLGPDAFQRWLQAQGQATAK